MKITEILKKNKVFGRVAAVLITLAVWQLAAALLNSKILLVGPLQVIARLAVIWRQEGFAASIWFSFSRIVLGFFLGIATGTILAALSGRFPAVKILLRPFMVTVRSVPVASFIVIALVWLSSASLSAFISFLMVLPIVYTNILQGIESLDEKMNQMAEVFRFSVAKRIAYVILPQLRPFIISACTVSAGLSWKAGIAAEIIGVPDGSIGEKLYQAKIYLDTADLFAWTVIIVLVSVVFEKLFIRLLNFMFNSLGKAVSANTNKPRSTACHTPPDTVSDIRISNLCKSFGDKKVLENISVTFPAGKTTCIMGASGCGKTTLINILLGIISPDSGTVEGKIGRVSAVFQEDRLCEDFSAMANLRAATENKPDDFLEEHLRSLNIDPADPKICREMSGGQKRRVAVARAVCADAYTVIMDEPFKGLDETTRLGVMQYVKRVTEGKTLLIVTHSPEEAGFFGGEIFNI